MDIQYKLLDLLTSTFIGLNEHLSEEYYISAQKIFGKNYLQFMQIPFGRGKKNVLCLFHKLSSSPTLCVLIRYYPVEYDTVSYHATTSLGCLSFVYPPHKRIHGLNPGIYKDNDIHSSNPQNRSPS